MNNIRRKTEHIVGLVCFILITSYAVYHLFGAIVFLSIVSLPSGVNFGRYLDEIGTRLLAFLTTVVVWFVSVLLGSSQNNASKWLKHHH
jgi:hypothetical protein